MKVLIFCAAPGLIVAGVRHPRIAAHALDMFDAAQLQELIEDPNIVVAVGHHLTSDQVAEFVLQHAPPAKTEGTGVAAGEGKPAATIEKTPDAAGDPGASAVANSSAEGAAASAESGSNNAPRSAGKSRKARA